MESQDMLDPESLLDQTASETFSVLATDGDSGDGSDCNDDIEKTNKQKCSNKTKLSMKRKLVMPSSSKKSVDKRARINRDNWNDELAAELIVQVELHPVIWDVNSAGFRNKTSKDSAWMKVRTDGGFTHIDDAECRRKWQHLCNTNNKLINAYYNAMPGESAKKTPNWVHWSAMEFVRKNKASYKTSTQSNLEADDNESLSQTAYSTDDNAKRMKRSASSSSSRTTTPTPVSTTTSGALEKLDAIIGTIGEGQTNPHLATVKGWAAVLNQMSPMYAARAKSEIKSLLSKYFQRSVAAEEEAAEKQYRSELAKTSTCITLDFVECGVVQHIFVLGNDLEKLDLSRHTKIIAFKANGELLTDPSAIARVEVAVGLRQSSPILDTKHSTALLLKQE